MADEYHLLHSWQRLVVSTALQPWSCKYVLDSPLQECKHPLRMMLTGKPCSAAGTPCSACQVLRILHADPPAADVTGAVGMCRWQDWWQRTL